MAIIEEFFDEGALKRFCKLWKIAVPPGYRVMFYPEPGEMTKQAVKDGSVWLYADIQCPHCEKIQSVAQTGFLGGPCMRCEKPTGPEED